MGQIFHDSWTEDLVVRILDMDENQLNIVSKAVRLARKNLAVVKGFENQVTLYVGDSVKLSANMSKKWMQGATGRIEKINNDDVIVTLDKPYQNPRTWDTTSKVRVAFDLVTKI